MGTDQSGAFAQVSLDDKYALDATRAYMTGVEALVRLPMLQHQRDQQRGLHTAGFISGYRGSPLGGVDQAIWKAQRWLARHNVVFKPGINEELAATAVWGSQQTNLFQGARYDGVFSLWYGKGPGVDRSMDVIKHANAFGTARYGGVLAVAGDDHACKSSTLPHQSEHNFIAASVPVLSPANVQEVLDLGVYGWELSRYTGCWVALKAITENMDSAISADIDPSRVNIVIPEDFELPADGVHARWPDKPLEQERRLNKYKIYAAREFARVNGLNRVVVDSPRPRFGIITSGKAYLDVMQALEDMGIDAAVAAEIGLRVYKVGMPWPLEPRTTHDFAEGLEEILVVEEKRSIIEDQLTGQLYNYPVGSRPKVFGEFDENGRDLLPNLGELTPATVALAIHSRIRRFYRSETMDRRIRWIDEKEASLARLETRVERVPHFCSGCPHNTSTRVPEGSHALGGIGCHYMATWMPDRPTETFTQMGGEGATWIGQAPFTDTPHVFQNLGDGTYFHSGSLAIRASVAAGVNITYRILYNDAVAMTGGQPIDGSLTVPEILRQVAGEGVRRIALVSDDPGAWRGRLPRLDGLTVHHRDDYDALQRELREVPGVSVIVFVQTCAAEKRRRRKKGILADPPKRLYINDAVCEGCGDCSIQSNCLSVVPKETPLGRKRQIDQSSCNKDYSCAKGFCPSFVTVLDGDLRKPEAAAHSQQVFDPLPEPALRELIQPWNIVVAGVGGTGVLTITALVAMAAHIEGKGCATMNQTGLAQKFGAVVSHVRVAPTQDAIKAVRIPAGEADLLVGCDLVVATNYEAMGKAAVGRSHAVINDAEVPTAAFILDPDAPFPTAALKATIRREVGSDACNFLDSTEVATRLLGDAIASNLFLLGYAWQQGLVPVSAAALERAIELNGVAVDFNKQAFLWGRRYAHQPAKVLAAAGLAGEDGEADARDDSVDALLADHVQRLTDYQDARYAQRYADRLAAVRAVDPRPEAADSLTRAVARSLYKLMAYKDEYEVARLYAAPAFLEGLEAQFEGRPRLRFNLAPPLLARRDPVTGHLRKREFGPWILPAFRLLAKLRFLRGTALDLFGYTAERRQERADIADYLTLLDEALPQLDEDAYPLVVELAALPLQLRGFGHVKDRHREQLAPRRERLLSQLRGRSAGDPVTIVEAA
ncbi:indolepyruvate ferredoxin oxidoreductase family protein [Pseudohaliea rubra]|uniref:Indolepyruvate ferredoxin oxidoreductase, alpha and beta subunit n=1 Tax=Pseudohaliea rubra DSM 19751 TaxID=1265313 RepID=A0A095VW48_9GAMM|nr:indolepyruvate ferredoxin oxidoreductase family protein [Pseudohaliea rubra]KGE05278.1 Indolepyruvate ferredoxin oxidoreductase, alpha and beta subunit [Pseudohaliea rubra DSM 19751]